MDESLIIQIEQGNSTAFINAANVSNLAYKPQLVSNNYKEGRKVLSSIEDELLACDEFFISVAFITMSGITPLLQTLKELEKRNVPGKIMTTDYLMFSEPRAMDKLVSLKNIELKMYCSQELEEGFHTKGYIFKEKEIYRIIVGSSNMTLNALTKNKEWNARLISTGQGEYAQQIIEEYTEFWNSAYTLNYNEFIDNYRTKYEIVKKQKEISKQSNVTIFEQYCLQPNKMQVDFINSLQRIKDMGENKALLISATGDGGIIVSSQAKTA